MENWKIELDNLVEKLEQILKDPDQLNQILDTAKAFGFTSTEENVPQLPKELTKEFASMMQQFQIKDQKRQALIRALLPYLRPGKQRRLERAMQITNLSHVAEAAFRGKIQQPRENDHV